MDEHKKKKSLEEKIASGEIKLGALSRYKNVVKVTKTKNDIETHDVDPKKIMQSMLKDMPLASSFLANYKAPDGRSSNTLLSYKKNLRYFYEFLQNFFLEETQLTFNEAILFKNFLIKKELGASTINQMLGTLKSYYEFLVALKKIETNPFRLVRPLRVQRLKKAKAISPAKVLYILSELSFKTYKDALNSAIIATLFFTGLRKSELLALSFKNIKKENGSWWVRFIGKGNKEREIVISPSLEKVLFRYLKIRSLKHGTWLSEDRVFVFENANQVYVKYVDRLFEKISYEIGEEISPHGARASLITFLYNRKVPAKVIQTIVGHARSVTTEGYQFVGRRDIKKAMESVDEVLKQHQV